MICYDCKTEIPNGQYRSVLRDELFRFVCAEIEPCVQRRIKMAVKTAAEAERERVVKAITDRYVCLDGNCTHPLDVELRRMVAIINTGP